LNRDGGGVGCNALNRSRGLGVRNASNCDGGGVGHDALNRDGGGGGRDASNRAKGQSFLLDGRRD
jgi:hypothetical protein